MNQLAMMGTMPAAKQQQQQQQQRVQMDDHTEQQEL
jgi:hypothetical protein